MNNSQFDEIVERRGTNCAKWDTFDVLLGGEKDHSPALLNFYF